MFHRVKTEEVQNDPQDRRVERHGSVSPAEDQGFDRQDIAAEKEQVQEQSQPQASKDAIPTASPYERILTSNQKKEADSMNAQAEDNNSGNERADRQAEQSRARSFENYQRQPGRVVTTGYPGAYPGSSYAAPAVPSAEKNTNSDRTLTIGAGITMSGEIESCDQLIVEGTIEASLKGAHVLEVAETGTFYGTVEIDEATIAGRFEGDLTVNGRLVIRSGGTITGTIAYRELEVEVGAVLEGKITPLKATQQAESSSRAKAKDVSPTAKPGDSKEHRHAPANSDGHGLFSEKAFAAE